MSKSFFRFWLPLSLVVHIGLFFAFKFIPIQAATVEGATKVSLVTIKDMVTPALPKVQPVPREVKPVQPKPQTILPIPPQKPLTIGKVTRKGINRSEKVPGAGMSLPGPIIPKKKPGLVGPGHSNKRSPAANVATGNGHTTVPIAPPGSDSAGTGGGNGKDQEGGGSGGGGISCPAMATHHPDPGYPKDALNDGVEGNVTILFTIDGAGNVSVDLSRSSGSTALDNSALRRARQWRFTPKMVNGKGVGTTEAHTFHFANGHVTHD
ncbi:MAG TPA: TonB family protein [Armatimonadota bacterium]|nr:TonB family protein [Armatimonadota bacterium]